MSDKTKIEWADATWSPVTGCTPVSEGCDNCYARRLAKRFPQIHGFDMSGDEYGEALPFSAIHCHKDRLDIPLRWRKPRRIFVCSMGDLFHEQVPENFVRQVFEVMVWARQHTFMLLTKRPYTARLYAETFGLPENAWLGVTAENQPMANERITILMETHAAKRFVSCEPLLGPIWFGASWMRKIRWGASGVGTGPLDWIIAGGETGPNARAINLDWARSLRDQCQTAGVPFFFKQVGPTKRAGHLLDGREWNEFPSKEDRC